MHTLSALTPASMLLALSAAAAGSLEAAQETGPDPLAEGQTALARGWYASAFRLCMRAAEERRQPTGRRAAAFVCQGRGAIGLKWPAAAISLAHRALSLLDESNAHLLLADGYRLNGECRRALREYLIILEREPAHVEARAGIRACGGELPVAPDGGAHLRAYAEVRR